MEEGKREGEAARGKLIVGCVATFVPRPHPKPGKPMVRFQEAMGGSDLIDKI